MLSLAGRRLFNGEEMRHAVLKLVDHSSGSDVGNDIVLDVVTIGSGPALLLLHGVEGAPADGELIEALAENFEVIVPSHPGFDLSPLPDWCNSVDDVAHLYLNWLKRTHRENVTVVGLQFGGWVAAEMAVRSSERIARLVLVDAVGIKVSDRESRDIADVFSQPHSAIEELIYVDPERRDSDFAAMPEEAVLRIARNEEALVHFGWEPYLHDPKLYRRLRDVDVPALVLWGDHDRIVSPDYGRAFADAMPDAAFHVIDNAGHRPQIEAPMQVAAHIREFAG